MAFLDVALAPMERVLAMFDDLGIPYEVWDEERLALGVPGIDTGRYWPPRRIDDPAFGAEAETTLGAVWTPDAGFVDDPSLAAVNLASAAERAGARFVFRREVVEVLGASDGEVTGVLLDDATVLKASVVVNAAGPWSSRLNQLAGVGGSGSGWTVGTRAMRQEVHEVPAPRGFNENAATGVGPCIADIDLGTYFRGTPGGSLLVGGTEPECDPFEWLDDPDDADLRATPSIFEAQVTRAARRLPTLGVPSQPRGIAGVYDVTDDWAPIYDRTELDGYFVAIGTSGNQFKNAPVVGKIMAKVIDGHTSWTGEYTGHQVDLTSFARDRARNADSTGTVLG